MLRIIIEQDTQEGGSASPHIVTSTTSAAIDPAQAIDGGKAPSSLGRRAIQASAAVPSFSHAMNPDVRDAGAAPRVLQAHAKHLAKMHVIAQNGGKERM